LYVADRATKFVEVATKSVSVVDKDRKLLLQRSKSPLVSKPSGGLARAVPTVDFEPLVNNVLANHVRRIVPRTGVTRLRSPVQHSAFSHLTEMIVRTALRESWNCADTNTIMHRIRQMMFRPDSDLVHVATYSGLEFVEKQGSHEQLHRVPSNQYQELAGLLDPNLSADFAAGISERTLI